MKRDTEERRKEFEAFLNAKDVRPPAHLTESILSFVHRELNPSMWLVMSKFAVIQTIIGSISLLICSQFGVGSGGLVHVFAGLGENICMALCGALFLGFGGVTAGFILKSPEVKLIRQTGYLPVLLMGVMALGIFFGFGAEIVLSLAFVWLLGGFVAGMLAIEATSRLRLRVA